MADPKGPEEGLQIAPIGADDDSDRWKTDPWLSQLVSTNQARYSRLGKELAAAAISSTDPAIRARGAQLAEIELQVLVMTGKRKLAR